MAYFLFSQFRLIFLRWVHLGVFLCDRRVFIALIIDVFRVSMIILLDFNSSIIKYDSELLYIKCNKQMDLYFEIYKSLFDRAKFIKVNFYY